MLADLFYLAGILYVWTKLMPSALDLVQDKIRRPSEVRELIYRHLLDHPNPNQAKVILAVDRAQGGAESS